MGARSARHQQRGSTVSAQNRLPAAEREFFERAFGEDFSQVRVHTDSSAAALTSGLDAKAVTNGEDIAFAPGRYRPGSSEGRALLAHELAHVSQQRRGGDATASQVEPRARSAAQTAAGGGRVAANALGGAGEGPHCDPNDDKEKSGTPGALPPLALTPSGGLDWATFRQSYDARGMRLTLRDATAIEDEALRITNQLRVFGITPNFKLDYGFGTFTYADLVNLGISKQLEHQLGTEQPNAWDRFDKEWQQAHPGGFQTPFLKKTWTF
jgi:hypothetical protein